MSTLSIELDRYLTIRRSLGYDLRKTERVLRRFIEFADQQGADHISTDLFLQWRKAFGKAGQNTWAQRLMMVRLFAQWLQAFDPKNEVPPQGLIPSRRLRSTPYIYSEDEIRRIIRAAAELPSFNGVRPLTYPVLFGLIAVTGLRLGEALALDNDDVDFENGVITVREGKFGRTRLLPLSESTTGQLIVYARERDRLLGARAKAFFVSDNGLRVAAQAAQYNFGAIGQKIGLRPPEKDNRYGKGPRIHDLRHSFAVRTILNWYRTGKDPAREMIKLTTYLGHVHPAHTYWYIEAVPELLELASARAEASLAREVLP